MTQLKCRTCSSESHATLLCRQTESGDQTGPKGKVKPSADGAATFTTDTEGKAVEPTAADGAAAPATPETASNMASTYDYLESEAYLLSRDGSVASYTHTCVGQTSVKDRSGREVPCGTLFDYCSTDAWVSAEFAKSVQAKRLPDWQGTLRTIRGTETVKLPGW